MKTGLENMTLCIAREGRDKLRGTSAKGCEAL